ncbi:MAG: 50S ribosomal protein L23 [Chloroflexi bacterium]|nr:50S ribosomal protein L23 [Chloroflexota bacterium]MBI3763949.1 50S ribosomal protein L23 [Chloroflexota bacterium]
MNRYDVLRRPIVTEKSTYQSGKLGQYAFEVAPRATKAQIKDAVENIWNVQVARVNVLVAPRKRAKRGRYGRRTVVRSEQYKKAIVTLAPGQTIEF